MDFDQLISETADFIDRDPGQVLAIVAAAVAVLRRAVVDGEEVSIPGFGTFGVRVGVAGPESWAEVAQPGSMEPCFIADESFKELTRNRAPLESQGPVMTDIRTATPDDES
jgi:DNA-binding protein HU-beta